MTYKSLGEDAYPYYLELAYKCLTSDPEHKYFLLFLQIEKHLGEVEFKKALSIFLGNTKKSKVTLQALLQTQITNMIHQELRLQYDKLGYVAFEDQKKITQELNMNIEDYFS